jgi:hypothetical protein
MRAGGSDAFEEDGRGVAGLGEILGAGGAELPPIGGVVIAAGELDWALAPGASLLRKVRCVAAPGLCKSIILLDSRVARRGQGSGVAEKMDIIDNIGKRGKNFVVTGEFRRGCFR